MKSLIFVAVICLAVAHANAQCVPSATQVGGSHAPGTICAGELLFEDNFDNLDLGKWRRENTLGGGGNWEFQWYTTDGENSFTRNGNLHLHPTFTADKYGEDFLYNGRAQIPEGECTNSEWNGCDRSGQNGQIINPIRSARVTTWDSFWFKYGHLEIRAKMPCGDWIW